MFCCNIDQVLCPVTLEHSTIAPGMTNRIDCVRYSPLGHIALFTLTIKSARAWTRFFGMTQSAVRCNARLHTRRWMMPDKSGTNPFQFRAAVNNENRSARTRWKLTWAGLRRTGGGFQTNPTHAARHVVLAVRLQRYGWRAGQVRFEGRM